MKVLLVDVNKHRFHLEEYFNKLSEMDMMGIIGLLSSVLHKFQHEYSAKAWERNKKIN